MEYRESKIENSLFYLCSLIECISRISKNEKNIVIKSLGTKNLKKIYELADVYHCENIKDVAMEFIKKLGIKTGNYDTEKDVHFEIPSVFDIGKVYKRLILVLMKKENLDLFTATVRIFTSKICKKIEDFNSSLYYDTPENIYLFYKSL